MCSEYRKDNKQTATNESNSSAEETLTFKDWKTLKDKQDRMVEKLQFDGRNSKPTINNRSISNYDSCARNIHNTHITEKAFQFVAGNMASFIDTKNFSGPTNNFGMWRNNFGTVDNSFHNFNNTENQNSYNMSRFYNSEKRENFLNCNSLTNSSESDCNGPNRFNQSSNFNLPANFFASDGIYRQRDMMQKPLYNRNPFKNQLKADRSLQELNKSLYGTDSKRGKKKPSKAEKSGDLRQCSEAKVYVRNPKAKIDGKPYILKPKVPEENLEISKEEKKQQWKEYRTAMKPFKNRDFYNAKRVVQRLGKKAPSALDDKELIRLTKSREVVADHKARLAAKYENYIKSEDNCNEMGEVYALKKKTDSFVNPTTHV